MENNLQFCTFYVENLYFGVQVEKVQEIIRFQEMTRVPLAHSVIKGLINLRGQIVTAIDLRTRMMIKSKSPVDLPMNVVLRNDEGAVSLLVDKIGDVIGTGEAEFEPPPETLQGEARKLILGTYQLKENLLLILDIDKIVDVSMPE